MTLEEYLKTKGLSMAGGQVYDEAGGGIPATAQDAVMRGYSTQAGGGDLMSSMTKGLGSMVGSPMSLNAAGGINPATGLGGVTGALGAGVGLFNAYDQYKTNKKTRQLMDQQLQSNKMKMDDYTWNKNKMRGAFGLGS